MILSVSGMGRCTCLEVPASFTVVPAEVTGLGLALALEVPVKAEACDAGVGLGDVEVEVWGYGLRYSSPRLPQLLADAVARMHAEDGIALERLLADIASSRGLAGCEALAASLAGAGVLVAGTWRHVKVWIPGGHVVVGVLEKPVEVQEAMTSLAPELAQVVAEVIQDPELALPRLSLLLARTLRGTRVWELVHTAIHRGVLASGVSYSGHLVYAVTESLDEALELVEEWREKGLRSVVHARLA